MNTHLGPEELADLQEGLLDPDRAEAATGHLRTCSDCRRDDEALSAVRVRLASAAEAGPMPADVSTRLDEALADAGRREGSWASAATVTVTPLAAASSRRTPTGSRVLQAAAAAVILLAVGALGVSALGGGGGRGSTSGSAGAPRSKSATAAGHFTVLATGTSYTQSSVAASVPRLLSAKGPRAAAATTGSAAAGSNAGPAATPPPPGLARLRSGPALADCITALADQPATPLAVDLATYAGSPAAVIVLPSLDDPASLDVWVVGPGCSRADDQFRYFVRVARP